MNHLSPDELIDAVEGTLDPARREHLATCEFCAREVANLASVLTEARQVDMPEPSPMFWDHFSARVRTAIDAEPMPAGGWTSLAGRSFSEGRWFRLPVLAPIAALALLVVALMTALPRESGPTQPQVKVATEANDITPADDGWKLVADLVGDVDWDSAGVAVQPGLADQAALDLSAQEQQELGRLLKAELERVKS
jgi:hypothetical protein